MTSDIDFKKLEKIAHEKANEIHKEFPLETRVTAIIKGQTFIGTVKQKPKDEIICYAPWDIPVK